MPYGTWQSFPVAATAKNCATIQAIHSIAAENQTPSLSRSLIHIQRMQTTHLIYPIIIIIFYYYMKEKNVDTLRKNCLLF